MSSGTTKKESNIFLPNYDKVDDWNIDNEYKSFVEALSRVVIPFSEFFSKKTPLIELFQSKGKIGFNGLDKGIQNIFLNEFTSK